MSLEMAAPAHWRWGTTVTHVARRPPASGCVAALALMVTLLPRDAFGESPLVGVSGLSYMIASGPRQYPVLSLLLAMTALMLAISAVVGVVVLLGLFRRRAPAKVVGSVPVEQGGHGMPFIYVGTAITIPLLFAIAAWTYAVLAKVSSPPSRPAFTIEVTGHQWWWEFRYVGDTPDRSFTTANELHIPVGKPVRIELETSDVIHSFWVPALGGKTDTIAGQRNVTWIEADKPGIYRGQCTEYCGLQHAKMGFLTIADPPGQFEAWWKHQLQSPEMPVSEPRLGETLRGQTAFIQHCAVCHAVRGTPADGRAGPDLSHLMTRRTIASATLPNTIGYLSGWISNPQHIKPGNYMPILALSGPELNEIRTFLTELK